MKNTVKRSLSVLLALLMCLGLVQLAAPVTEAMEQMDPVIIVPIRDGARLMSLDPTTVARETYEFYVDDALYRTVIVKASQDGTAVVNEPARPDKPGYHFTGWYTGNGELYTAFGEAATVTDGAVTRLYAHFQEAADAVYIHYHDDEPSAQRQDSILYTAVVGRGDSYTPRATDVEVSQRSEDNIALVVTGWKDAAGTVYDVDNPITTDAGSPDEIDLYPVMSKGAWLFFDANGGVYLDPQFVPYGEVTREVTTTRDGYRLDGWFDGETRFEFGGTLDTVKTLTARWTPEQVTYHIEVWQEAPTYADDSYYLEETIEESADAGMEITLDYLRSISEDYVQDRWGRAVLSLNEELTEPYSGITVEGDGSTVTRIYMQRSRHTLVVLDYDGTEITRIENVKYDVDDWTYAGFTFWETEVWSNERVAEINAIKGENGLSKYFWNPSWWPNFWLDPGTYNMHFRKMNNKIGFPEEVSIRATERSNRYPYVINNYFEYLDDEVTPAGAELVEHTDSNGVTKSYYLDSTYTVWLNTASNGHVDIGPDGFHLVRGQGNVVNGTGEVLRDQPTPGTNESRYSVFGMSTETPTNIFYARNTRTVRYIPGKGYDDTVYEDNVPFNDLISKYPPEGELIPNETVKTVENVTYRFMGWSQTENGEPISGADMAGMRVFPDKDYTFYGVWAPEEYTVRFDLMGGTFADDESVTVVSGSSVPQPANPENGELKFVGWYTRNNTPYYFGTLLTKEVVASLGDGDRTITLYAHYSDYPGNPVKYYLNGGTGTAPADDSLYCVGTAFSVASGDGITPPAGKVFVGWEAADGQLYQDGSTLRVSADTIKNSEIPLTARWGADPVLTMLTYVYDGREQPYQPDFGAQDPGSVTVSEIINNDKVVLGSFEEVTGLQAPDGFFFAGWYSDPACTGDPLTEVIVDTVNEKTENIVYAKWLPCTVHVIFDENGGSDVADQTLPYGEKAVEPTTTRPGYTFDGWMLPDGTPYDFDTPVTEDITLIARWIPVEPDTPDTPDTPEEPETPVRPDTGDGGAPALWAALCVVSLGGTLLLMRKRRAH